MYTDVLLYLHASSYTGTSIGGGGARAPGTARLQHSSLLLIKPHVVMGGRAGNVIKYLCSPGGFSVSAAAIHYLDKSNAEEFLQVYKGTICRYIHVHTGISFHT